MDAAVHLLAFVMLLFYILGELLAQHIIETLAIVELRISSRSESAMMIPTQPSEGHDIHVYQ